MSTTSESQEPMSGTVEPGELVQALGEWVEGEGPRYQKLSRTIGERISGGDLAVGARLPPERALADALGVSRSTVVAAYDNLRRRGIVESRQGSGTWVATAGPELASSQSPVGMLLDGASGGAIAFTMANLPASEMVGEAIEDTARGDLSGPLATHGYEPYGQHPLRTVIADHYNAQNLPTSPDEVLVTTGSQQAIALVASALLSPGDTVLVEDPTYSGALDCFRALGARMVALPLGEGGIRADLLRSTVARVSPKLIYVCPVHNPTGLIMSEATRVELARLADRLSIPVLEDLTLAHVTFDSVPPSTSLYSTTGEIVVVESASKVFWGGLRVGWVRGSRSMIQRIYRQKAIADLGTPLFSQLVVTHLLPRIAEAREIVRRRAGERLDVLVEQLGAKLPSWRWERPAAGLSLWAALPQGNSTEFARLAQQRGVAIVPGPAMSADANFADCLRLPYVLEPTEIEQGIDRLAAAWSAYEQADGSTSGHSVVV